MRKEQIELLVPVLTRNTNIDEFLEQVEFDGVCIYRGNGYPDRVISVHSEFAKQTIESIRESQKAEKLKKLFNGLSKEDIQEYLGINQPVKAYVVSNDVKKS